MSRRVRWFVWQLFAPPAWAREAETAIALVARRRQRLIAQLETIVGR